jgi:XPB/Ssl2-like helicase family protein
MYDVVPGALQRLREADIVSMAGLTAASLGQEYCRIGAVYATKRQGARLSGIVEVTSTPLNQAASTTNNTKETQQAILPPPGRYATEVELRDRISCGVTCSCNQSAAQSSIVCPHAAALLYHWLAHPMAFTTLPHTSASPVPLPFEPEIAKSTLADVRDDKTVPETIQSRPLTQVKPVPALQNSIPTSDTAEILAQSGLSELRSIAREHDIPANGLSKQQLAEAIVDILNQPEAIRRVVATLEKQQRQLLAALTLAGGSMNDEDLRGLFERFSLGGPGQLQNMLHILQGKALIVRAAFNSSLQPRIGLGLSSSTLEICWYVPPEVRAALHVTLPVTPFTVEAEGDQDAASPKVRQVEPYSLLTDLLLVARALDSKQLERDERRNKDGVRTGGMERSLSPLPVDDSIAIPAPNDTPSIALLESLQAVVPRPLPFLRFAIRLLRLADILYFESDASEAGRSSNTFGNDASHVAYGSSERSDVPTFHVMQQNKYRKDAGTSTLHALPNAAELLLGSNRADVAHELFTHWLNQPSYEELFDLQEEGLRLRCRATPLNQPALRSGELEIENRDARQTLVALLAQAPSGQWINFSAFARFVYRLNPTFLQRRQRQFSSPHWWIEQEEGRPLHLTKLSDWTRAEGRYLAQMLQGPLHWWGICDVALSADERLLAFQLTPLADSFLNGKPMDARLIAPQTLVPKTSPFIDVSEAGDLFIPCTFANWPLIELIERFAQIKGVHAAQLCYRLTPGSLSKAFSRGESPTALLELLHRAAEYQHSIVPDSPLARLLAQLERRIASYGRVRVYTDVSLLEAADQQVLRELSATTSLNEQIVRPIHPTLLILKKQAIERLVDELKRRGQVPLLHDCVGAQFITPGSEAQHGTK